MALTEEPFVGIQFACGVQTALGTINDTIRDLAAAGLDSTDGVVLGYREAGDANTGITLPTLVRLGIGKSDVGFTPQANTFLRADVTGLSIAVQMMGNGAASGAPDADAALPVAGLDALWRGSGLTGASGASPAWAYTPASSAEYITIKLWVSDHTFCFQDVLASVATDLVGGVVGITTFTFEVGSLAAQTSDVVHPTDTDYLTQASLSAPVVQ
ncbi:unnamed protein product, partial [marine sediment metagenome]